MSHPARLLSLFLLCLSLAACGGGAGGGGTPGTGLGLPPTATLVVMNHDNAGPGSLRQAVADAPPGAWITFDPALPTGAILLDSPIVINKVLTIGGLSGTGFRHGLDGQIATGLLVVEAGALQLNDLMLDDGLAGEGAAIASYGAPVICWRVEFTANHATQNGGAIAIEESSLEIYDSFFLGNFADGTGGAVNSIDSVVRIERTSWYVHQATDHGGVLHMEGGTTTLVNCSMHESMLTSPLGTGGAISVYASATTTPALLRAFNCTITDNDSLDTGAGIHVSGNGGVSAGIELHRTIVARNDAPSDRDISYAGTTSADGSYNIIGVGGGAFFHGLQNNQVGDAFSPVDPMLLLPAGIPSGGVAALPIPAGPAVDAVPAGSNPNPEGAPMVVDQRLFPRDLALPSDIGAIEL